MKLLKLYLKGFTGIKKGMGIDEITIDLTNLSGLIALAGPNGQGKTTVLECLQPFRRLISRKKTLNAHVFLRDSVKELTFELDDNTYRTLIKIDSESDRMEGFIYKNGSDASETTGKVKEYDAYIKDLFGSPELFFNSIFCAQNSDKISDLTTGELKKLFSEFLRLDKLIANENTAKQCVAILIEQNEKNDRDIEKMSEKVQKKDELRQQIAEQKNVVASKKVELETIEKELITTKSDLEKLYERKNKHELALQRIQDIEANRARIKKDIESDGVARDNELLSLRVAYSDVVAKVKIITDTITNADTITQAVETVKLLETDIESTQGEITRSDEKFKTLLLDIGKKEKEIDAADEKSNAEIKSIQENIEQIKTEIADGDEIVSDFPSKVEALVSDAELQLAVQSLNHCQESASALTTRPDACKHIPDCPAFESAEKAKLQIPELEKTIADRHKCLDDKKTELNKHLSETLAMNKEYDRSLVETQLRLKQTTDAAVETLKPLQTELQELEFSAETLHSEREKSQTKLSLMQTQKKETAILADKFASIEIARAQIETLETQKQTSLDKGVSVKNDWLKRIIAKEVQLTDIDDQLEPLKKTIADDEQIDDAVVICNDLIKTKSYNIQTVTSIIASKKATTELTEKMLTELENVDASMKAFKVRKKYLAGELSDWNYLRNACSKDGLRALEIDSVAPVITGYANQLLNGTFGSNYSVKLRTVDPETGREVLDIIVIDEDGNEKLLDVLSGGQKVWSLKALRLAMTLISKEKNDKNFQTALSDEEDGALDPENACHFIRLYREFMRTGGFETCFYITHKPDCVTMADHIIDFKKGGVTIS